MNKINSILILLIALLVGGAIGQATTKYAYDQLNIDAAYTQTYIDGLMANKISIQENFLRFYVDDYCDGRHRVIDVRTMGNTWVGIYCDKDTVLVLSDAPPHLPIATLNVDTETDE